MLKSPCRDCYPPTRHLHCRANCEAFQKYEAERLEGYKRAQREKECRYTQSAAAERSIIKKMRRKK